MNPNPKADIWSFGCITLEMLTGVKPWGELRHPLQIAYKVCIEKEIPSIPSTCESAGFLSLCFTHEYVIVFGCDPI